ncbi:hypothetical protein [Actinospica robiniae]|uniref:hypothetical protein n=1 Tax=Actinospica robiniae TaxID=304901 RepID=UPI00055474BC|nr:hypothetical protein [Actinospica robiniae]
MEEPREYLDPAYQDLMAALQQSRRRLADLATARKRFEHRLGQLHNAKDSAAAQLERARAAGDVEQADAHSGALMGFQAQIDAVDAEWRASVALEGPAKREAARLEALAEEHRHG